MKELRGQCKIDVGNESVRHGATQRRGHSKNSKKRAVMLHSRAQASHLEEAGGDGQRAATFIWRDTLGK